MDGKQNSFLKTYILFAVFPAFLVACSPGGSGGGGGSSALPSDGNAVVTPWQAPVVEAVSNSNPPSVSPQGYSLKQSMGSTMGQAQEVSPAGYSVSVGVDNQTESQQ
jgi:hypothetical protein